MDLLKQRHPDVQVLIRWVETLDDEVESSMVANFQSLHPGVNFFNANSELEHILTHIAQDRAAPIQ